MSKKKEETEEANSLTSFLEDFEKSQMKLSRIKRQVCYTQTCDQVMIQ